MMRDKVSGSGYEHNPAIPTQEGDAVAKYLCQMGINVFIVVCKVTPAYFPLPVLDGRRAMRNIRYYSEKFGINKNKIATISYSAGGHLAASVVSYTENLGFEGIDIIDEESYTPDFPVLSCPVICLDKEKVYSHKGSADHLLDNRYEELKDAHSFENVTRTRYVDFF